MSKFEISYNYCILCWRIKGYNSALYTIQCELIVIKLWLVVTDCSYYSSYALTYFCQSKQPSIIIISLITNAFWSMFLACSDEGCRLLNFYELQAAFSIQVPRIADF